MRKSLLILLLLSLLVNLLGISNDLFSGDSAVYASISKSLAESGNLYELKTLNGGAWLDKPHFPFWIWAISIKLFGATTFAFKAPALLFFIMALVYAFLLARRLYNLPIAWAAVLILSTSCHIVISNNDIRAEVFLLGLITGAVYHFQRLLNENRPQDIVLGSLLAACAIMTKGIFVLIPIGAGIVAQILFTQSFKALFRPKWLLCLGLIFAFILPELYSLYLQFAHESVILVNGKPHQSYLQFFFWDSQFGRFFNTGPIKGNGQPLYFFHVMLWAFAPWVLLLLCLPFRKTLAQREYISPVASLVTFLVFSASSFQLPHYTNILFPFLAIMLAGLLFSEHSKPVRRFMSGLQWVMLVGLVLAWVGLQYFTEPGKIGLFWALFGLMAAALIYFNVKAYSFAERLLASASVVGIALGLAGNLSIYPNFLRYQAGKSAAEYVNQAFPNARVGVYGIDPHLFHYYSRAEVTAVMQLPASTQGPGADMLLLTAQDSLVSLNQQGIAYNLLQTFDDYPITRIERNFLNAATRRTVLQKQVLLRLH